MISTAEQQQIANKMSPFWSIAFRPFFALGAGAAVLLILVWLLALTGQWPLPLQALWHGHEMLYGFGLAILAGFVLTASQNWAGLRGVHGRKLQVLVFVWLLGRLGSFLPWPLVGAALDLLFVPCFAYFLHPYLSRPGQERNRVFYVLLSLFLLGNLLYHLEQLGVTEDTARRGLHLAVHLFLAVSTLIAGRIIPAFTRNAIVGAKIRKWAWLEKSLFVGMGLWLVAELFGPQSRITAILALILGALHALRWLGWYPWQTCSQPILAVLPLGYAWMIVGFVLRGLDGETTLVLHVFTLGVMGGLMHAMLTRVSLGHTGRKIETSIYTLGAYLLLQLAIILRGLVPRVVPAWYLPALVLAGISWIVVFGLYLWEYLPILLAPRPDGKES